MSFFIWETKGQKGWYALRLLWKTVPQSTLKAHGCFLQLTVQLLTQLDLWLIAVWALCSTLLLAMSSPLPHLACREVPQYPRKLWQIFTHHKWYHPPPKHSVCICLVIYCILSFNCGLGKALQQPQRWAVNLLHLQLSLESSHIYSNIQKRVKKAW